VSTSNIIGFPITDITFGISERIVNEMKDLFQGVGDGTVMKRLKWTTIVKPKVLGLKEDFRDHKMNLILVLQLFQKLETLYMS
jgi:hypothetical protein